MDQIPTYARGKRNPETIAFIDDRLRPITEATKGVILYQEQSMQIAKTLAGFSRPEGGRPAQGDRQEEPRGDGQAQARVRRGLPRLGHRAGRRSRRCGRPTRSRADYSFNKSHAACYALISYRTAWLKANYPAEYMAALISSVMDTKDKVPFFVNQAESMGIEILPPDVNLSDHEFVVVDGNIRFGLDAVKGVGYAAVEAIKGAREKDGPFTSLWDFCERVDGRAVNKKAIEALIKCGAFGSTGATRKGMLEVLESAQAAGQKAQLDAQIGQGSIFDLGGFGGEEDGGGASPFSGPTHPPIPIEEFDSASCSAMEKESIGLFITEHPLKRVRDALRVKADATCAEVPERRDGEWVKVGGMIAACKKIRTRSGSTVMFATLDDLDGQVELLVFEKVIVASEALLQPDQIVLVRGTVDHGEDGKICVKVADVTAFDPSDAEIERARDKAAALAAARAPRPLHLRVDAGRLPASVIDELKRIFEDFPGESEVVLEVHTRTGLRRLRFGNDFRVAGRNAALKAELDRVLGPAVAAAAPVADARPDAAPQRARALEALRCADRVRVREVLRHEPLAARGRALEHARQPLEARLGQERGAARAADLAVAEVRRGGRGWSRAASRSR